MKKYPKLIQQVDCKVGILHDYGRIEPLVRAEGGESPQLMDEHAQIVNRMVRCYAALEGLSDHLLDELVSRHGGRSGPAAERIIAWSLFMSYASAAARKYQIKARDIIEKGLQ